MEEQQTGQRRVEIECYLIWKWILGSLRKRQVGICFEQRTCLEIFDTWWKGGLDCFFFFERIYIIL